MIRFLTHILDIKNILGLYRIDRSQVIRIQYATADPTIYLSCTGGINIISIKNGKVIRSYYADLNVGSVSVQSDANTPFAIYGDVTYLTENGNCLLDLSENNTIELLNLSNNNLLTSIDLSDKDALTNISINYCSNLTSANISGCSSLAKINFNFCSSLSVLTTSGTYEHLTNVLLYNTTIQDLDLSGCTHLASLDVSNMTALRRMDIRSEYLTQIIRINNPSIEEITCRAMYSTPSTNIAGMINNATSTTGDLYVNPSDPYVSVIITAASNKGWTVHTI